MQAFANDLLNKRMLGKSKEDKGITRLDTKTTHGFFVRGYRNGKTFSKVFSDRKCKGRDKALKLAREYRDKLFARIEMIPRKKTTRIVYRDKRNTTGVIGVTETYRKGTNGKILKSYSVSWRSSAGVQKSTSFAVSRHGEKEAFRLAVSLRKKMTGKRYAKSRRAKARKERLKAQV